MKVKCYAVFDKAVAAYLQPFYARADGEAIRSFIEACKDGKRFAPHVLDFTLFRVGEFDDSNGMFSSDAPERLITGSEIPVEEKGG